MRLVPALVVLIAVTAPLCAQEAVDGADWPTPAISDDISALPAPVQAKRQALIEAARSGDLDALAPIIDAQQFPPNVSFGAPDDVLAYLRSVSEDDDGRQLLGVLLDLFDQPYAYYPESGGQTNYIWPYLAEIDPNTLDPEQTVDAYRLLDTAQLDELKEFGAWFYWRTVINESGEWTAFVAGD